MNIRYLVGAAAMLMALALSAPANAQPTTKLTGNLSDATVQAIWCSSMFLEESYFYEEGSEDSLHYEDMAYELGDALYAVMKEAGLPEVERDEIWFIFDEAAAEFAASDDESFMIRLFTCEESYLADKLTLF